VLVDDVVDRLIALEHRRSEVIREDALYVEGVLNVPGLVEVELSLQVFLDRGRDVPLGVPKRISLDRAHHPEREEDDEEDHGDRPEDTPDDECGHVCGMKRRAEDRGGMPSGIPPPSSGRYDEMLTLSRKTLSMGVMKNPFTFGRTSAV